MLLLCKSTVTMLPRSSTLLHSRAELHSRLQDLHNRLRSSRSFSRFSVESPVLLRRVSVFGGVLTSSGKGGGERGDVIDDPLESTAGMNLFVGVDIGREKKKIFFL